MTEGEAPAESVRRSPSWFGTRLLGVLACAVAAALAIAGSFLPLVSGQLSLGGSAAMRLTVTGWKLTAEGVPPALTGGGVAQNGYPLTVSGALLIIAAIFGLIAAIRTAPAGARSLAVLSGAVAAAFLAGTVATVAVEAANVLDTLRPAGAGAGGSGFGASLGAGFWLELVAVVLAIAAVVLVALPVPRGYSQQ
ncbi:hypothetical protein [Amycolatopsis alkalitolerans]|uniref:Uncharacterized protein n=1 Tax=Amycolatopsis alkalitolerans TaxID=2547244 RepID=A0A5C4M611_9PSEU|nr:hypothetical protein [Amycolatopsis alkalitolerans]TNC28705.1 hypothetical protein FG385_05495 [Amycolatopsis alkalitolerans]